MCQWELHFSFITSFFILLSRRIIYKGNLYCFSFGTRQWGKIKIRVYILIKKKGWTFGLNCLQPLISSEVHTVLWLLPAKQSDLFTLRHNSDTWFVRPVYRSICVIKLSLIYFLRCRGRLFINASIPAGFPPRGAIITSFQGLLQTTFFSEQLLKVFCIVFWGGRGHLVEVFSSLFYLLITKIKMKEQHKLWLLQQLLPFF